jgi:hypothetical protein
MTKHQGNRKFPSLNALRRYVPLAVWVTVILTVMIIPLKIIGYGFLPSDDALRHGAKVLSGKPWSEILVLNDVYKMDHEFGWNWLLEEIQRWTNWNAESLVVFSVVALFVVVGWSALPWLKRPEAWLATLMLVMLSSAVCERMALGRPYLVTSAILLTLLFLWQRHGSAPPKKWMLLLATALFAVGTFVHGVWYLWVLLLGAFVVAGAFRWAISLGLCWVAGVFIGSALTGHPFAYPLQAFKIALLAVGTHGPTSTKATELQPFDGNVLALVALGGLLVFRQQMKLSNTVPLAKNPAFWLACGCWMLGFQVERFWIEWGCPALMVLLAWDLELFLQARFAADSFKRLGLALGLAAAAFLCITSDVGSRWSRAATWDFLTADNPAAAGWLPDRGGIFYSADMNFFYDTFYKNPKADWRYQVGFEPALMPGDDFKTYQKIIWNIVWYGGTDEGYQPWISKMQPPDRLAIRSGVRPNIPALEWKEVTIHGLWIGRLPRTNAPPLLPVAKPVGN